MRKVSEAIASHPVDSSPAVVIQSIILSVYHWSVIGHAFAGNASSVGKTEFAVNVHSSMLMSLPF